MKMKKAYIYVISFCSLVLLLSGCYYLSYKAALIEFNRNAIKNNNQIIQTVEENRSENQIENQIETNQENKQGKDQVNQLGTIEVEAIEDTVKPSTKYTLEVYNIKENTVTRDSLGTPEFLIGLTRNEVINYLVEYMGKVPLEEYEKGLVSYELVSFSTNEVVLRKTYNSEDILYRYYIIVLDGFVTVYYSDKVTVYEYTEIKAQSLSEEEQNKLVDGIYVKDEEELYGILENYTS